ncbi:hypothetical protein GCM10023347_40800 [Streptomyces chumphonensis]|uniref:Amino acid adenylation domain-containing protein n=1 Tax=Streptomyces chumphonensis TaxID=1214925 RepID=A0A927IBC0_9ACTN|nr:amino acid adenylation domain-containing protein [Streptomyces chumphonensis]MBD3930404.1 amino acid adenylation domain-containing protein [Streptomyces chumphonensis]
METENYARILCRRLVTCLPSLLNQQAEARPDDIAVVAHDRTLSYQELSRTSGRLAAYLHHLGARPDDCVGLFVDPSVELMTGVWGILGSGAAYLPLSPEYPEDRLRYMIEDSRTRIVVTEEGLVPRLRALAPQGTRIVTVAEAEEFTGPQPPAPCPSTLAYVIYTSGSTGKPKGVMIEHNSIVAQMRWLLTSGHLGPETTVLQKTPMSFDAAQWEILAPATGSRVVMGTPGIYRDPEALVTTIAKHEVTTLQCVPTLLQALLDTEALPACTSLRRVFSGGEALSNQLARQFAEQLPEASLVNLYGPTECTINATAYLADPEVLEEGAGSVPIGIPVDSTQCYILDANMAPAGIGETGELYIGGVQLARGYLHKPEQTRERFVASPFVPTERLYRTGDLASWNPDGTIQFAGRADNQVKLRGYRVELEEIALAIEEHTWVRRAAALVTDDARTGFQRLVACVELNPKEAALMDQGVQGGHHMSKSSKLQVKAQLSGAGLREDAGGRPVLALPGRAEPAEQRRRAFARKTYRFYEGGDVTREDLLRLLAPRGGAARSRPLEELTLPELGTALRWFGQFHSDERLLPKYAHASPGALYATQMYLETGGLECGVEAGVYYYHPADHTLVAIPGTPEVAPGRLVVHFSGKRSAIEPVYKNNIREVLEFEAGHMVGLFEEVLPEYGLDIRPLEYRESVRERLDVAAEDYYLGTFEISAADGRPQVDPTEVFVQAHGDRVAGLPEGQYHYADGALERISDELVRSRHVIAINQAVYDRAGFGITAVSRAPEPWLEYVSLGVKLHHLQASGLGLGLMSAGYSSKTGNPLPAARRMDDVLTGSGFDTGPLYFFVGGRVSEEQLASEGMHEDAVHMKGPAEMIKDELAGILPDYMLPNQVLVLSELPLTANGKVDSKALAASDAVTSAEVTTPYVAPATRAERWLAKEWGRALKYDHVSVEDDFFASGGNSLIAVSLINKVNREFGTRLPMQSVFQCPKLGELAARVENDTEESSSRLLLLNGRPAEGSRKPEGGAAKRPVFCWPGLGGYPMNLRLLGGEAGGGRPFYGVQAYGINAGEVPYRTIREMASADVSEILSVQPEGPYTLWGYSFGARVAFETAWQLEQLGKEVETVLLICPGNPSIRWADGDMFGRQSSFDNPAYVAILFSVFVASLGGEDLERCLARSRDEDSFVDFIREVVPALDEQTIRRITRIVGETYQFEYTFEEMAERRLRAPVTIFRATGDEYSFIEDGTIDGDGPRPTIVDLDGDHYSVLKEQGVGELASAIRERIGG